MQARHDVKFNSQMDRVKCKPWGLEDGLSGFGNSIAVTLRDGAGAAFHNGKALNQVLHAGGPAILHRVVAAASARRSSDLDLARDVRCGYVSKDAAEKLRHVFGRRRTGSIHATKIRRAGDAPAGAPQDEPIALMLMTIHMKRISGGERVALADRSLLFVADRPHPGLRSVHKGLREPGRRFSWLWPPE